MKPSPLPSDDEAAKKLQRTLKGLSLPPQAGSGSAADAWGKKYLFPANPRNLESLVLERDGKDGDATLVMRVDGVDRRIACGCGAWRKGRTPWNLSPSEAVAASGAWTADGVYTARLCFYETPFIVTVKVKFSGNESQVDAETNVGFGPTKEPQLTGKCE